MVKMKTKVLEKGVYILAQITNNLQQVTRAQLLDKW